MNNRGLPSLIAGTLLVIILVLYMITYQVRFTEVAVVKTFGKASPETDVIKEPGLYWKWPWPIQQVAIYDNRLQLTSNPGEETPTRDGKPIIVATSAGWRIADPYKFNTNCGDEVKAGADRLLTLMRNDQKTIISHYDFNNFVSTDQQQLQYDKIEREILAEIQPKAADLYGIQVESIVIERLSLPQRVSETVFEAMKQERRALAARYTSEGESRAQQIKAEAEGIANTILSFADRKATEIVVQGTQQANRYYEEFKKDEDLAIFLQKVENLPRILKERSTTLVLGPNTPLLDVLFWPSTQPSGGEDQRAQGRPDDLQAALQTIPEIAKPQ
jgi:membrane protease subunit HflC